MRQQLLSYCNLSLVLKLKNFMLFKERSSVISAFRCGVNEILAIQGFDAALIGSILAALPLRIGLIGCPKMSGTTNRL
jgi:hypothetical protein